MTLELLAVLLVIFIALRLPEVPIVIMAAIPLIIVVFTIATIIALA